MQVRPGGAVNSAIRQTTHVADVRGGSAAAGASRRGSTDGVDASVRTRTWHAHETPSAARTNIYSGQLNETGYPVPVRSVGPFNRAFEFPNYLLPKEMLTRRCSRAEIDEHLSFATQRLERCLKSVFDRMTIPVANPETGDFGHVRLLPYLEKQAVGGFGKSDRFLGARAFDGDRSALLRPDGQLDDSISISPAFGTVRAAVGYIYSACREGMMQHPPISPEQTLRALEMGDADLPFYEIKGAGSDMDFVTLVDPNKAHSRSADNERAVHARATRIINLALERFGQNNKAVYGRDTFAMNKALFPFGDVSPYKGQIDLSMSQGGSTIDWLVFDPRSGKLVNPPEDKVGHNVARELVRGAYHYSEPIEPPPGVVSEDLLRRRNTRLTAVRGMRSLIELPHLFIQNGDALKKALGDLERALDAGESFPDMNRLAEQLMKAWRNARENGGGNRVLRVQDREGEHAKPQIEPVILRVMQKLAARARRDGFHRTAVPEYLPSRPLPAESQKVLPGGLSREDFLQRHTDGGVLYHASDSVDGALSILRGGPWISRVEAEGQEAFGQAVWGSGFYMTPDYGMALRRIDHRVQHEGKKKDDFLVLPLAVSKTKHFNVLDWPTAQKDPFWRDQVAQLPKGTDLNKWLAAEHNVDVLLTGQDQWRHVVLLNSEVLEPQRNPAQLISALNWKSQPLSELADRARGLMPLVDYAHLFTGENPADGDILRWVDALRDAKFPGKRCAVTAHPERHLQPFKKMDLAGARERTVHGIRTWTVPFVDPGMAGYSRSSLDRLFFEHEGKRYLMRLPVTGGEGSFDLALRDPKTVLEMSLADEVMPTDPHFAEFFSRWPPRLDRSQHAEFLDSIRSQLSPEGRKKLEPFRSADPQEEMRLASVAVAAEQLARSSDHHRFSWEVVPRAVAAGEKEIPVVRVTMHSGYTSQNTTTADFARGHEVIREAFLTRAGESEPWGYTVDSILRDKARSESTTNLRAALRLLRKQGAEVSQTRNRELIYRRPGGEWKWVPNGLWPGMVERL